LAVYGGIDVAARHLHCVGIDNDGRVVSVRLLEASELDGLAAWAREAEAVGVDAPAQVSTGPHADDPNLPPKFRTARCAEIDLRRVFSCAVPWTAPMTAMTAGWMLTGLTVFDALRRADVPAIEVYPYAGFRELAGRTRPPKKTTAAGIRARIALLERAGVTESDLEMWSHDALDACLGAVIARDWAHGNAQRAGCGHDESAIWLPSPSG